MRRCTSAVVVILMLVGSGCGLSFADFDLLEEDIAPFEEEALNFLVVGDWGRTGWFRQDRVARRMGEFADETEIDFVISTGDNFYDKGVDGITDPKWRRSYERIYSAPSLQVPWYVTLGNHDYLGDITAQIEYTEVSDRWVMPDRYFSIEKQVDDTTQALFLFLDTVSLIGGESASTREISEEATSAEWDPAEQLRWLDSTLAHSDADWRFAVGHHPIYSASAKHSDAPELRSGLAPILEKHGVQAYLCGHVHSLQHLKPEGSDLHHFVSGGGSLARKVHPDTAVVFASGVSGFMAASLTPEAMRVHFIDYKGTTGHVAEIPIRKGEAETR